MEDSWWLWSERQGEKEKTYLWTGPGALSLTRLPVGLRNMVDQSHWVKCVDKSSVKGSSLWRHPGQGRAFQTAEGMLLSPTIPFPRVLGQSRGSEWILSTSSPGSTERHIWPSHRKARTLQVWFDLDWSRSVLHIHSEGWQLLPSCKPFFFHSYLYSLSLDDQLVLAGLGLSQFSNWKSCVPGTPSVLGNLGCLIILLFCHKWEWPN